MNRKTHGQLAILDGLLGLFNLLACFIGETYNINVVAAVVCSGFTAFHAVMYFTGVNDES